ncbi:MULTISPECIES: extracellular solute-binding protein [Paenibacillus]|uniref:ABC transporter substrate-binding protein n=1 Tax=Paenibacillus helianthi TaxID=1349432 RepID=A0ABX3EMF3_9BACL|nr:MULTISPECIES: extracellular solute-binding protein [Paenibacillus]OKP81923.1 ABC transporter substrate-binding protein [Paenibacillus sp. P3E]OKP82194.1 ABC transporter substrate-binding protein [Paenibacillus sp. P32E]OKP83531.1 ABC transporter substrate-binding protein [Paenibacillus helianthi]OKP99565.1 ABC transporter substrate-binding protein [Paenibacillus sp. P46E]
MTVNTNQGFWKKATGITLTAVMGVSLLAGCSSDSKENAANGGKATEGSSAKRVTLKVEVFDRGNSPAPQTITNNFLSKLVQKNFGDPNNIDVQYVPIQRSEEVTKLNVLMASDSDVPDIVFTYDSSVFYRYAGQGGLTDVGKLLDEYGPNLKKFIGDETLAFGQLDGKQFSIPGKRAITGRYSSYIRQDWLDKLSLPVPKTTDELYTTLKAFKEKDPGKLGSKNIPMGMALAPAQFETLIYSFIKPISGDLTYSQRYELPLHEGFKDAMQFMNKLYNEGLISKDFGLDKDKTQLAKDIQNGNTGYWSEDVDAQFYKDGTMDNLYKNVPGSKVTPVDVYTNAKVDNKYIKSRYASNGMYIMIPKSSKRAVEAIKYLDWMSTGNNLIDIYNGVEGENYDMVDGIPVVKENVSQEFADRLFNGGDMAIISNGKNLGDQATNEKAWVMGFPKNNQEMLKQSIAIANTDTVGPIVFGKPIEGEAQYGTTLTDKLDVIIVKTTMAKPDQFEAVYEQEMKDFMSLGGTKLKEELEQAVKELPAK